MFAPNLWKISRLVESVPEMLQLQREMNRLFSNIGQKSPQDYPAVNIWENPKEVIVTAELPGMNVSEIDISVLGDALTIAGNRAAETFTQGQTYLRQERAAGSFKRGIKLPFAVEARSVEAKYERGLLTVTLPRQKDDLPKKIKIN